MNEKDPISSLSGIFKDVRFFNEHKKQFENLLIWL